MEPRLFVNTIGWYDHDKGIKLFQALERRRLPSDEWRMCTKIAVNMYIRPYKEGNDHQQLDDDYNLYCILKLDCLLSSEQILVFVNKDRQCSSYSVVTDFNAFCLRQSNGMYFSDKIEHKDNKLIVCFSFDLLYYFSEQLEMYKSSKWYHCMYANAFSL